MKIKLTNLFFIMFLAMKCIAQEKPVTLSGHIYSFKKNLSDIHIINLNNKHGTISNVYGIFKIVVKKNDTILLSSIQFERKKIRITENHVKSGTITIQLIPLVTILDEVFLKGLTGNLEVDIKRTPKDTIPKHNFVFNRDDVRKLGPDYGGDLSKPPNAEAFTNPIQMNGVGTSMGIPDKRYNEQRRFKRTLSRKKLFPTRIKRELGTDFFIKDLTIPEEKIDNFISYCEYRNIIDKYYQNKLLEVIQIFQQESIHYNAIKK